MRMFYDISMNRQGDTTMILGGVILFAGARRFSVMLRKQVNSSPYQMYWIVLYPFSCQAKETITLLQTTDITASNQQTMTLLLNDVAETGFISAL